tara:strand:+ start:10702 stop:14169 length:3468 start_codon:yes stop_codon:yes gene_type:complete
MFLKSVVKNISESNITDQLLNRIKSNNMISILGFNRLAKALILSSISELEQKNILLICSNIETAMNWNSTFEALDKPNILFYPYYDENPYEYKFNQKELENSQLQVISNLLDDQKSNKIIIATHNSLQPHLPDKGFFKSHCISINRNDQISIEELSINLTKLGYKNDHVTTEEGYYSRRGYIFDIFPVNNELPIRIEFFDNIVDKIREFDPITQKSLETINKIRITPNGLDEIIRTKLKQISNLHHKDINDMEITKNLIGRAWIDPSGINKYIPEDHILAFDDIEKCKISNENWYNYIEDNRSTNVNKRSLDIDIKQDNTIDNLHLKLDVITDSLRKCNIINLIELNVKGINSNTFDLKDKNISYLSKNIKGISRLIQESLSKGFKVWIISSQPSRTVAILKEQKIISVFVNNFKDLPFIKRNINSGIPIVIKNEYGSDIEGFNMPKWKTLVISDKELYGQFVLSNNTYTRKRNKSSHSKINPNRIISGDYIVHKNHGIGQFEKIERITIYGESRDYLVIKYLDGKLSVAADQLNSITRYRRINKTKPLINKLGGTQWEKTKAKQRKIIKKVAKEIIELYAERSKLKGHAFPQDGPWQKELEDSFPYIPTNDQIKAVVDIKKDMESEKPMDRLICGDVGFGKTEVAIRAIFKAITSGKQVILLTPTTVLAHQHWNTIKNRFAAYPIKVSLLNRFIPSKERKEIINKFKTGLIEIIISTHQILNCELNKKKLGLLVIDEEQRFGVNQKEKIKSIKKNIDVLSLSATPIPRTLYMSLSGVREMSLLSTPPPSRRPIKTNMSSYDPETIRSAIKQEIERGGQVFYVVPRISKIDNVSTKLKQLIPNLKFIVAHGQMKEEELEKSMLAFNNGNADLMICTTIIESGLDIPRVNTIIIEDSHVFGLSQLYQLRGRVGRSGTQAFAWLLFPELNSLNEASRSRLKAIQEFSELGSGYQLAMRDMEIRGVGNILGIEQTGQISSIGFDLYMNLLNEAISELSGNEIPEVEDTQIELPITAFIPANWIADKALKLNAYKQASECNSNEELALLASELIDRYGKLPKPVESLFKIMKLKLIAKRCGFSKIKLEKQNILIETIIKESGFKNLRKKLPQNLREKFIFKNDPIKPIILIRGLSTLQSEDLIDSLTDWLLILCSETNY